MIFLIRSSLLAVLLLANCSPVLAQDDEAQRQQLLTQLQQASQGKPQLTAILLLKSTAGSSVLTQQVHVLQGYLQQQPQDQLAKMFYGYGQLFLATDFLNKKNYMRAAELSKQGFFAIDEAAETDPDNWRLRFLRARMDAFVPGSQGRCVITLKDTAFLRSQNSLPEALIPFITLMSARAQQDCQQAELAKNSWQQLATMGTTGQWLMQFSKLSAPEWTVAEIEQVLLPAVKVAP